MTGERNEGHRETANKRALALVTQAIDLLDAHGGSPEAAAYLELARQKLMS